MKYHRSIKFLLLIVVLVIGGVALRNHKAEAVNGGSNCQIQAPSVATTMITGHSYAVHVYCQNQFGGNWTSTSGYKLFAVTSLNVKTSVWSPSSVTVATGVTVTPSQTYDFSFNVTAPSTAGTYTFAWEMGYNSEWITPSNNTSTPVSVTVVAPPTCSAVAATNSWVAAASSTNRATVTGVSNATAVRIYEWSVTGGQDDLTYYAGTSQGGGAYYYDMPLSALTNLGAIDLVAYVYNSSAGWVSCASSSFTYVDQGTINVNSNKPTSWTITCPLTSPTCSNISSGANQTTGSYTNKPFSTWTITPSPIAGYDVTVTPSTAQTFN